MDECILAKLRRNARGSDNYETPCTLYHLWNYWRSEITCDLWTWFLRPFPNL